MVYDVDRENISLDAERFKENKKHMRSRLS